MDILCRDRTTPIADAYRIVLRPQKGRGSREARRMKAIPFIEQHYSNILGWACNSAPYSVSDRACSCAHSRTPSCCCCLTNGNIIKFHCALDLLCKRICGTFVGGLWLGYVYNDIGSAAEQSEESFIMPKFDSCVTGH